MEALTPIEARILGVLVEKQRTVPDSYPLSLNALVNGCNQKNNRVPVMEIIEADASIALDGLRARTLIIESSGNRVARFAHNAERGLGIPGQSVAIIATLILRGPQTAAELRLNCERLHKFSDISAIEGFLSELSEGATPLVIELPRQAGKRENRWVQLLCGAVDIAAAQDPIADGGHTTPALELRMAALESEVAQLRGVVETLQRSIA